MKKNFVLIALVILLSASASFAQESQLSKEKRVFGYETLYFELGSSELTPLSKLRAQHWSDVLAKNTYLKIDLVGHTDCRGSDESNMELSIARAEQVKKFLLSFQDLDGSRIVTKGAGEKELVNRCSDGVSCSEAEHNENRRVQVIITVDKIVEGSLEGTDEENIEDVEE